MMRSVLGLGVEPAGYVYVRFIGKDGEVLSQTCKVLETTVEYERAQKALACWQAQKHIGADGMIRWGAL